jgi:hypothetical protein
MQSSRKHIHMCCSIQPHRHTDTSSHENNLNHHIKTSCMLMYICSHWFLFLIPLGSFTRWSYTYCFCFLCPGLFNPVVLHMICQDIFQPWSYVQHQWFQFMIMLHAQIIIHLHFMIMLSIHNFFIKHKHKHFISSFSQHKSYNLF